jgi:hypothetical protein
MFDKAMDKVEQSVGDAREKTGLEPDNESEAAETDSTRTSVPQADDKIKNPE